MNALTRCSTLLLALVLGACATYPTGPNVMALPGSGLTFDQFRVDDVNCRGYAQQGSGGTSAQQTAANSGINSAVVGTAIGAAAGALIGAASGDAGTGAAIGAGGGLLLGSAAGTDAYGMSGSRMQNRYDSAYLQCMYAKGHQVPVPASVAATNRAARPAPAYVTPAPALGVPPGVGAYPPPGTPPPPGY